MGFCRIFHFLNHPAMGDPPGKPQFKAIVECTRTGRMILTTKVWTFLSAIKIIVSIGWCSTIHHHPRIAIYIVYNWLVVWNMTFLFQFSWECHHPNWPNPSFVRGVVAIPPTRAGFWLRTSTIEALPKECCQVRLGHAERQKIKGLNLWIHSV